MEQPEHIPSREKILAAIRNAATPLTQIALQQHTGYGDNSIETVQKRLRAMERDGQISINTDLLLAITTTEFIGAVVKCQRDGRMTCINTQTDERIFLGRRQAAKVFDGDEVRVITHTSYQKLMGKIVEVTQRNTTSVVGTLSRVNTQWLLHPQNPRNTHTIYIDGKHHGKVNDLVTCTITAQPTSHLPPRGTVTQVLGKTVDEHTIIAMMIHEFHLETTFSQGSLRQCKKLPANVGNDDLHCRFDLRDTPFVTIDGEDAKDFDDAVYCQTVADGWKLSVAIADVAEYVPLDSPLDADAKIRGTSVYFPNTVMPMLPEQLANNLCSLLPQQDRLVITCAMKISATGELTEFELFEGVIHSQARLTYTEVAAFIATQSSTVSPAVQHSLLALHGLFKHLHAMRQERGAIEFTSIQSTPRFSKDGNIESFQATPRNCAHLMIEEAMLLTNVCVAKFMLTHKSPGLYRVHSNPTVTDVAALRDTLLALGIKPTWQGTTVTPKQMQQLLELVKQRQPNYFSLVEYALLRSLPQANYQQSNAGHFGLGYQQYCHFTSPIRRYPDLVTHRAVKAAIHSKLRTYIRKHQAATARPRPVNQHLPSIAAACSRTERVAEKASRMANRYFQCLLAQQHLNNVMTGVIRNVTAFGLFVNLPIEIEGLLHIRNLDNEYYVYASEQQALIGQRSQRRFAMGDSIKVKIAAVDIQQQEVDLRLVDDTAAAKKLRKSSKHKRNKK